MKFVDPCGCFPTGRIYPGIAHLIRVSAVGLAEEFDAEEPWAAHRIAFIDTETTGTSAKVDRVIEVGIVIGQHAEIRERHNWLINPGIPIPKESSDVHGITNDAVRDKPRFEAVAAEIVDVLRDTIPAAYNAAFDKTFLIEELERSGLALQSRPPAFRRKVTWLDPLVYARELYKGRGESRALGAVAERLGISLDNAHRATDDAEAALRVLYAFRQFDSVPDGYSAFVQEQRRLAQVQLEAQRFWRRS